MKKISILLFYFVTFLSANGQLTNNKLGQYFDVEGENIQGYYDLDYQPEKPLEFVYNIGIDFSPGYYYTSDAKKIIGFIKYLQNNSDFKFKSSLEEKAITIKASQSNGFVIGIDSFATINYSDIIGRNKMPFVHNQLFAEVIEETGRLTFYKQFNTNSSAAGILYYVKTDTSKRYFLFPHKKDDFKDMAIKIFGNSETIIKGIKSGKYTGADMLNIIKLYKNSILLETQGKIFLNSSFNETKYSEHSTYYGKVVSFNDSTCRIVYFENTDLKIYEGEFSSFRPLVKEGTFIYYFPNGSIRKKIFFERDKPISGITYHDNGLKHQEFTFVSGVKTFKSVSNITGQQLLNNEGEGKESIYDTLNNRELIFQYTKHKLTDVYFIDENQTKIHQYCQNNVRINMFNELQREFQEKITYPIESIKNNDYGIVLLKCQIDPKGKISKSQIIRGINTDLDQAVLNFAFYIRNSGALEPGKVDREKVHQEVIIPFRFSLIGFTRTGMYNSNFWTQKGVALLYSIIR